MLLVAATTTLVVVAFAVPLAVLIRHNVYQSAVQKLERTANDVALYVANAPTAKRLAGYLSGLDATASVQLPNGSLIGTPPPGGLAAVPSLGDGPSGGTDEHGPPHTDTTAFHGGQLAQLLVPAQHESLYRVLVYESDAALHSDETQWWLLLAAVSLGLLVVGIVGAEVVTRRIVAPLVDTAATARALSAGDTTARAPTDGPREIGEVGASVNRLADRIDELIIEERETVADLSHRLRTPLTALRLDAEALGDPAEAERIGTHVSELERTLTAVIRAARRPEREGRMPSCDATGVVGDRVAFWSALAEDQRRTSVVALPAEPLLVRASAEDLAAAIDALLENVFAHTPEGTSFEVRLVTARPGARLAISDDGPGLPPDALVRGRSDRGSSGLGLDIARRCAEASGGSMSVATNPGGGAQITLELGAP